LLARRGLRAETMTIDSALRKIRLLSRITLQHGASKAEAETASKLAQALMERFCIRAEDARSVANASSQLTWVYWERLLGEFGIELSCFGRRGNAQLGSGLIAFIKLDTGHWCVKKQSSEGWKTIASDWGVESWHAYLKKNGPCSYSMAPA
jgi:hypothetical protein